MPICRICQHTFKALKFQTKHTAICTRCVNTLNESPEPARNAERRLTEMLTRGMRRNAERDIHASEEWKRRKAVHLLENFDSEVARVLPDWINRLLAKPENSTRDFKIMRALRRGLLRMEGFADYPSEAVWTVAARGIRARDSNRCTTCGTMDAILDVHHIVYLSKYGTNQQSNLITLCRPCHETEHGREFDFGEVDDPESMSPMRPPPSAVRAPTALEPVAAPEPHMPHELRTDIQCPECLTADVRQSPIDQKISCPQCRPIYVDQLDRRTPPPPTAATTPSPFVTAPPPAPAPAPAPARIPEAPQAEPTLGRSRPSVRMWPTDLMVVFGIALALTLILVVLAAG